MKYLVIITFLVLIGTEAQAQLKPPCDQYLLNPFLLNPAYAGTEDYIDFKAGFINLLISNLDVPKTSYLSVHSSIMKKRFTQNRSRVRKIGLEDISLMM